MILNLLYEPRASLLLLSYNQEGTIRTAAQACLAQECEPIEIIFSDDASTDASFQILQEIGEAYRGPHQLKVQRNDSNFGIAGHYNQLIAQAQGELLITAAGDDISETHRVRTILAHWDADACSADLLTSHLTRLGVDDSLHGILKVDDLAQWTSVEQWLNHRPYVVGAAHAFTKRLHAHFGDFNQALTYEDQIMALRASHLGTGLTIPESLVKYREGGVSDHPKDDRKMDSESRRQALLRRHRNHRAMYAQVLQDLETIGKSRSFPPKMKRRLVRSEAYVDMLEAPNEAARFKVLKNHLRNGPSAWIAGLEALWITSRL